MHDEGWEDPREGHRGHVRGRVRMRGGPGPGGPGPFQFEMRGGPFGPPKFRGPGGRGPRVRPVSAPGISPCFVVHLVTP